MGFRNKATHRVQSLTTCSHNCCGITALFAKSHLPTNTKEMQFWAEWDIFLSQAYTAAAVAISCENTTHCVVTQAPAATQMSRCNNNDFVLSRLCMFTVCELWALSMRPWPPYLAEEAFVGAHVCAYVPFFNPLNSKEPIGFWCT